MKLAAFEEAVVAGARRTASDRTERGDGEAAAMRRAAWAAAAEEADRARTAGAEDADRETARLVAEAGRGARGVELAARRELFDRLVERTRAAARSLRDDPDYPRLLDALTERARDLLGPAARVVRDPPAGGVVAEDGERRLTFSLDALAERAALSAAAELLEGSR